MKFTFQSKVVMLIFIIVILNALGMIFLISPIVQKNTLEMEEKNGKAKLEHIYDLIQKTDSDLKKFKEDATENYKNKLKDLTLSAEGILMKFYNLYKSGKLTEDEAKKQALDWMKDLRYGKNDYFYISDYNSVLISHPELMGRDFSEVKDVYGNLIVPNLVKVALEKNEGFTSYWWRRIGEDTPSEKLTYSKHFPQWKWVFGTGVYIDDIDKEIKRKKEQLLDGLRQWILITKIGKTGYLYIFDNKHNLIIHPNQNIEGKNLKEMKIPKTDDKYITTELMKVAKGSGELYYYWDKPEDPSNYNYYKVSWVKYYEPLGLYISSSAYMDDLNQTSVAIKKKVIYISSAIMLFSLFITFFITRKLINPIKQLGNTASQIRSGNLSVRSRIMTNDEIGLLSREFDEMLDKLVDTHTEIENLNKNLENTVEIRTKELSEEKNKISVLLNNADEGFFMIDNTLKIGSQFSKKCVDIFQTQIDGCKIDQLLFGDSAGGEKELFKKNISGLFKEEDSFKVECILSLMPSEFIIKERFYTAKYKLIDKSSMMIVFSDITNKKKLEQSLDDERKRLKFVVGAVKYKNEVLTLIEEFRDYCNKQIYGVLKGCLLEDTLSRCYREIHTFKGNFLQYDFVYTPSALHVLEQELANQKQRRAENVVLHEQINMNGCVEALQKDIIILKENLNKDFLDSSKTYEIPVEQISKFKNRLKFAAEKAPAISDILNELYNRIEKIQLVDLKKMLTTHTKMSIQLAQRLGKEIKHFDIKGDNILVKPELYHNFSKNMVHLFRNAVDHGIETPEERIFSGKDEAGAISCEVVKKDENIIEIIFKDDGKGVDLEKVREKISIKNGLKTDSLSFDEILSYIFEDGMTTKDSATELSGRGVGLSSFKGSVEELGGFIKVNSFTGVGTTFKIVLPYIR